MSRGRRYNNEAKLNYKKVFAVIIAIIVLIISIIAISKLFSRAKETKTLETPDYYAIYSENRRWYCRISGADRYYIRKV